jgi:hypothetical protein
MFELCAQSPEPPCLPPCNKFFGIKFYWFCAFNNKGSGGELGIQVRVSVNILRQPSTVYTWLADNGDSVAAFIRFVDYFRNTVEFPLLQGIFNLLSDLLGIGRQR